MSAPGLELRGVCLEYASRPVLSDVDLHIRPGRISGLLGRSGCGKSTLLYALAGLHALSAGEILRNGQPTSRHERLGQAGYVPQRPSLLPWRTVLNNLLLPAEIRGRGTRPDAARELLERFGLSQTAGLYPHQLSGGMAQRVAVLRAALLGADLLLLDEPFSALDALTRLEFQDWLRALQRELRLTVVLVTHDVREAARLCDDVAVLDGQPGRVTWRGEAGPGLEQQLLCALQASAS